MTYTDLPSDTTPRGLSISANVVYVSARPSPSVSTSRMTRPTPLSVDSDRFGSTQTKTAPSGDSFTHVGYIATGGPAKSVTLKPGGALKSACNFCSTLGSRGTGPLFGSDGGLALLCPRPPCATATREHAIVRANVTSVSE